MTVHDGWGGFSLAVHKSEMDFRIVHPTKWCLRQKCRHEVGNGFKTYTIELLVLVTILLLLVILVMPVFFQDVLDDGNALPDISPPTSSCIANDDAGPAPISRQGDDGTVVHTH